MAITALSIMDTMKKWVEERHPVSAGQWLDASGKLNVLRSELDDRYFELESFLSQEKATLLSGDMTSAKAESLIKAKLEYLEMRKLGAKIKQLEEFIRIAKKQATLKNEEYINGK